MNPQLQEFIQQLINGLSAGAIYALIAVGYTMVYGVLRLINFAHGDVFMIGAVSGWYVANWSTRESGPSWLALIVTLLGAMAACALLGLVIERFAYRPLRDQPRINSLITAIGVSMFLEFSLQHPKMFGATPRAFPSVLPGVSVSPELFRLFGVPVTKVDAMILIVTVGLMIALRYIIMHTKMGLALRAVSHRFDTASLMGININRVVSFTFVLGSVLAAVAGVLYAIKYPKVEPLMGIKPGVKAFVAAVLGGIGNLPGAVVGGLLLGLIEAMVTGYLYQGSQYRDGVAFVILIIVLLVKPSGIFGTSGVEKV